MLVISTLMSSPRARPGALFLLVAPLVLLVACGEPERVNLASLVGREDQYDGKRIEVRGQVTAFEDDQWGRYYVVEDPWHNRVRIEPAGEAEPFEGREVTVSGRFSFREDEGRRLDIDEIAPATTE